MQEQEGAGQAKKREQGEGKSKMEQCKSKREQGKPRWGGEQMHQEQGANDITLFNTLIALQDIIRD
jgi:hypothetical protein